MSHDYNKLSEVRIWDMIDYSMIRQRFGGSRRPGFYPSEASVIANTNGKRTVLGGCHRSSIWRLLQAPKTNPSGVKTQYIFGFGNMIEDFIRDKLKESGVFEASSVKFFHPKYKISGELDIVLRHPDGGYIVTEVKSTYGYYSSKTLSKGPKDDNLMQILTYLWVAKDNPSCFAGASEIVGGKLIYLLRDDFKKFEFDITMTEEDGKHFAVVNGVVDRRFTVEDIVTRYDTLMEHATKANQYLATLSPEDFKNNDYLDKVPLPARDFSLYYTDSEIEAGFKDGTVAKTTYEKWKRNKTKLDNRPGHWRCSYCDHKDRCWTPEAIKDHLK